MIGSFIVRKWTCTVTRLAVTVASCPTAYRVAGTATRGRKAGRGTHKSPARQVRLQREARIMAGHRVQRNLRRRWLCRDAKRFNLDLVSSPRHCGSLPFRAESAGHLHRLAGSARSGAAPVAIPEHKVSLSESRASNHVKQVRQQWDGSISMRRGHATASNSRSRHATAIMTSKALCTITLGAHCS
jgi:hypothetical protein